jgi:diacylglycerol kinase (ATP)
MAAVSPVLFFVNPDSGSGLAAKLIRIVEPLPGISIVRLPGEAETFLLGLSSVLSDPALRVVACGGDGTANWVVSLMEMHYRVDSEFRPPMAVIPFGTGNDLSRALGWGGGMDSQDVADVAQRIDVIRKATKIENVDVWQLRITNPSDDTVVRRSMLSYFSIGVDAELALDFEACRHRVFGRCICCHCMSLACYFPVACQNIFGKRLISEYCQIAGSEITADGEEKQRVIEPGGWDRSLVFQAIPSMYAGRDPWGDTGPRSMTDRKLEICFQGGVFSLGWCQLGLNTSRPCCQVSGATVTTTDPFTMQIDGEGITVNGPRKIELSWGGSYPLIFNTT